MSLLSSRILLLCGIQLTLLSNGLGLDVQRTQNTQRSKILDNPECRNIVPRCEGNRNPTTDLEALDCILNHKRDEVKEIPDACNHALWAFRKSIMDDSGFFAAINSNCHGEIEAAGCARDAGDAVICAIEHKENLRSEDCRIQVSLVERVMFSDYAVIGKFADTCKNDIEKYQCGRVDLPQGAEAKDKFLLPTSQGATIECLSRLISNVTEKCAIEILRVAELQAEDYHLDRALYFACRDDREIFCKDVAAGNGKVYRCLLEHKMENRMSEDCRVQLLRRQKLTAQDFRISSLPFACKAEIKKFKCRKGTDVDKHVRLSQILLCLENAGHGGQALNGECIEEMRLHRKSLMEDHQATPELLADCSADARKFCPNTKPVAGSTIHCLMQHAMSPRKAQRITPNCRSRLEELLKLTDVGENWNVDPVLKDKCQQVVLDTSCREVPSNQVMTCLMHLLTSDTLSDSDAHAMTDGCESALLQIQYFMTRDFTINTVLYEECKRDAQTICGINENWNMEEEEGGGHRGKNTNAGPLVLSCLYRNVVDEKGKVTKECGERVREAMRQRALVVSLSPELEENCLEDLSDLCSERTKPGEEIKCLQSNLDSISKQCRDVLVKFSDMEMKDPSIDPFLWKYCSDVIDKCNAMKEPSKDISKEVKSLNMQNALPSGDTEEDEESDDILQCLIKSKHEMKNKKCRGRVEYIQLFQLKHYDFSAKFKALCHADVVRRCSDIREMTASRLVNCLSIHIWNDTLHDQPHRISKPCRKQVKYLTMSKVQLEDTSIHDGMYAICKGTVERLCADVSPGGGRILECLREKKNLISDQKCLAALFPLQQSVDQDAGLDVFLANQCQLEIKTFCSNQGLRQHGGDGTLITCLKLNAHKNGFDQNRCGKALRLRLLEQNSDFRLNPRLHQACRDDIPKICSDVLVGEGRILECLKEEFVRTDNRLSGPCEAHIQGFLEDAAEADVRLDYTLNKMCHQDIESSCRPSTTPDGAGGDKGRIEECLKELFLKDKIRNSDCKVQVRLLIQTTEIDIHVDPILHRACSIDVLKRCDGILPGEGRVVACLLNEYDRENEGAVARLSPRCRKILGARAELFELAGKPMAGMESIQDLYVHVKESSHRNYFLLIAMSVLGVIFVLGLFCGRSTRRRAAKDK